MNKRSRVESLWNKHFGWQDGKLEKWISDSWVTDEMMDSTMRSRGTGYLQIYMKKIKSNERT